MGDEFILLPTENDAVPDHLVVDALGTAVDDLRFLARQHPSTPREIAIHAVVALLCAIDDANAHLVRIGGLYGLETDEVHWTAPAGAN